MVEQISSKIPLLCPVPCEHIESAVETCKEQGSAAFGTQRFDMFLDATGNPKIECGTPVLIYVSMTADGPNVSRKIRQHYVGSYASYEGSFKGWVKANKKGHHDRPELRPKSTRPDTPLMGFWEIRHLQKMPKDRWVALKSIPRYPMRVV